MKLSVRTLVLGLALTLSHGALAEEVWKITSLNWEPYSGESLPDQGQSIEKLRQILAREGIRLEVEFYPWKRAQALAGTEDYVGYFPAWPEEVADGFVASAPVDWSEIAVMSHQGSGVTYKSVDQLFSDYAVGLVKTYVYPDAVQQAMKAHPGQVEEAPTEASLVEKLSKGRHPAAITDPNVMQYYAAQQGLDNIRKLATVMEKELVVALRDDAENSGRIQRLKKMME